MNVGERGLTFDESLDALSHIQRRNLLIALLEHNPQDDAPVVISDSAGKRKALERLIEMEHIHLPKLVDYGLIEWDEENHEVHKGPQFDEIRPLLELLKDHEDELPENWL